MLVAAASQQHRLLRIALVVVRLNSCCFPNALLRAQIGFTALHSAASSNSVPCVRFLVQECGVDAGVPSAVSRVPLRCLLVVASMLMSQRV